MTGMSFEKEYTPDEFLGILNSLIDEFWQNQNKIGGYFIKRNQEEIIRRLRSAVFNEMRNAELCALWVKDVPDIDLRMALAKQAWQEFRHYKMVCDRLRKLGVQPEDCEPIAEQREFFDVINDSFDWLERTAKMQFAAEGGVAYIQNEEIIKLAEELGDHETAALYRGTIQPDERFHKQIGVSAIRRYATTPERQQKVYGAVQHLLRVRSRMFVAHHQKQAQQQTG